VTHHTADTAAHRADAQIIWDYHQMRHELRPCSAAIGLGSHDLGVATFATDLFNRGLFKILVFSGGNSPTTADRFSRGAATDREPGLSRAGEPTPTLRRLGPGGNQLSLPSRRAGPRGVLSEPR
jgi:hypothetical protein